MAICGLFSSFIFGLLAAINVGFNRLHFGQILNYDQIA